jgi:hypothetical protein
MNMTDEIPDNVDLRFLATQNMRILRELGEVRVLSKESAERDEVIRAQIARVHADVAKVNATVSATQHDVLTTKALALEAVVSSAYNPTS